LQELTPAEFVFGLAVAIAAAMLVFWHADRHGNRRATAWGIVSFFFPAAVLVYFWRHSRRRRS
jgi:high-affinity Fe2+/Pb2+ permease